jgi:hypothetical protein
MAIDYGKGISKTNENISKMNKAGKHFMGKNAMQVAPAAPPKPAPATKPVSKPKSKKK